VRNNQDVIQFRLLLLFLLVTLACELLAWRSAAKQWAEADRSIRQVNLEVRIRHLEMERKSVHAARHPDFDRRIADLRKEIEELP
jgi:hypothetical protein